MSPLAGFLLQTEVFPRLISAIPQAVSFIGSEDAQELIQDGTLIAAHMIHNAERSGKKLVKTPGAGRRGARKIKTISAGNIAYYSIQKLKCGRTTTGSSTVDVYGSGTQINGTTRLTSLDEAAPVMGVDDVGEPLLLHDVLSRDEEDPATKAARKMDWQDFMSSLSAGEKSVVLLTIEGKCGAVIARALMTSASTVRNSKHHVASKIIEFMGSDILIQIRRKPSWKDSLDASRERLACREERRHL